jgi:hypothetical protein
MTEIITAIKSFMIQALGGSMSPRYVLQHLVKNTELLNTTPTLVREKIGTNLETQIFFK